MVHRLAQLRAIRKLRQDRTMRLNRSFRRYIHMIANTFIILNNFSINYNERSSIEHSTNRMVSLFTSASRRPWQRIRRGMSSWYSDYISPNPTYPEVCFQRRFVVPLSFYFHMKTSLLQYNGTIWKQRCNGIGRPGHPTDVKILVGLRLLSSGAAMDTFDDMARMSETSIRFYFRTLIIDLICLYGTLFLNRFPSQSEMDSLHDRYMQLGFPGCVGAIDCMKFIWKNCPKQLKGQYHNSKESRLATIQCEAWCDHDRYVWSWFSGRPGSNNDLNILAHSPLFQNIFNDRINLRVPHGYTIDPLMDIHYVRYFLVDGRYPRWPIFAKPIHDACLQCERSYSVHQEGLRKNV